MNLSLLDHLADPETGQPLTLTDARLDDKGRAISGTLLSGSGKRYPIVNGIPRFVEETAARASVDSFGDQWNHFNFDDFHEAWKGHTVKNTFGSTDAFRDRLVVDAGGGSGAQALWMLQSGARHVIMLELSHSVDDVVMRNLGPSGYTNWDVVQCSIDRPPLRPQSVDGIVICHNVIQHTPSVERTARALFATVAPGGEFVFNCYPKNDAGLIRWIRFHLVYSPLRAVLSRCPFWVILAYARCMAVLRLVPGLGTLLEKMAFCVRGDVQFVPGGRLRRAYRATVLNTFDCYGSHGYQHHKTDAEILALVGELQPDRSKVLNVEPYFQRPAPIGCALRVLR